MVVRAQEQGVVGPQGFSDERDFLLGAGLLDDYVAVPFRHEAGEPLELGGPPERYLETLPLHLSIELIVSSSQHTTTTMVCGRRQRPQW